MIKFFIGLIVTIILSLLLWVVVYVGSRYDK